MTLPHRPFPDIAPPPGGAGAALRRAARRRRAWLAGSCAAVLLPVAAAAGVSVLRAPAATSDVVRLVPASDAPHPTVASSAPAPSAGGRGAVQPGAGASPIRSGALGGAAAPAGPGRGPGPQPSRPRVGWSAPMDYSDTIAPPNGPECAVGATGSGQACPTVQYAAGSNGAAGEIYVFLCPPTTSDWTVRFAHGQEVDLEVTGNGRQRWSWARGRAFSSAPHDLVIPSGDCGMWTTTWPLVDDSGTPLPPGSYTLTATVLGEGLSATASTASTTVTQS